jgi:hypothetical protein
MAGLWQKKVKKTFELQRPRSWALGQNPYQYCISANLFMTSTQLPKCQRFIKTQSAKSSKNDRRSRLTVVPVLKQSCAFEFP